MNQGRYQLVVFFFVAFFSLSLVRLIDLVFIKGEAFLRLATANRFFTELTQADRGLILDRKGRPLALNLPSYWLKSKKDKLFPALTPINRLEALEWLASDSAWIKKQSYRFYPLGSALAQTVGFLRPVTQEDLRSRPELNLSDRVGQAGLEKRFDRLLRGEPGFLVWEVDALGQKKRLVSSKVPVAGQDLKTTLSADLSQKIQSLLEDQVGAVVVLDAKTGGVLSLVSSPSFDPNLFSQRRFGLVDKQAQQASISALFKDPAKPFFNRTIAGTYPPGSIFKLVTALAGLESGKLDPDKTVLDQGVLKVGDYEYANWYFTQYGRTEGRISLVRAIARSNDIYFYKAAEWTGPEVIANLARTLGLGSPVGIELSGEAKGLVPDPAFKAERFGQKWYLGNTYHLGIGQGDILVTPLQLASLTQVIASYGQRCSPHLLASQKNFCSQLNLDQANLDLILEGMIQACSPKGTAFPFFQYNAKLLSSLSPSASVKEKLEASVAACKTGTAEFGPVLNDQGHRATHAWFTVYLDLSHAKLRPGLGADFPRKLVITVLVESTKDKPFKEGSADAAPIAKAVVDWLRGQD